jgi:hypothetical protein
VDEHIVRPEVTRDELIRGRKVVAMPAALPHATRQFGLDSLLEPHIHPAWEGATELLTRVSQGSDFATDVCIVQKGTDPATGQRFLEEVSFEIINEQSMRDIRDKAEDLTRRGVRRIFAVFVKTGKVGEWSAKHGDFVTLAEDDVIEDRCFIKPIPVRALLDQRLARAEAVRAYDRAKEPAMLEIKAKAERNGERRGERRGRAQGMRAMLLEQLSTRFGELPAAATARVRDSNPDQLRLWAKRVLTAPTLGEVFGE